VEPGGGWRHDLVSGGAAAPTLRSSSDIGGVENKPDKHADQAAVLAARACGIHAVAAATAVAATTAVFGVGGGSAAAGRYEK
jgi:hypothetical protein